MEVLIPERDSHRRPELSSQTAEPRLLLLPAAACLLAKITSSGAAVMASVLRQVPTDAAWDLLPDFVDDALLSGDGVLLSVGKCQAAEAWISSLWDACPADRASVDSMTDEASSSLFTGLQDTHSVSDTSEQHSNVAGATTDAAEQSCSSSDGVRPTTAASPSRCNSAFSLSLDYNAVLRTLSEQGTDTVQPVPAATLGAVTLQFPIVAVRDAQLRAAFGSYAGLVCPPVAAPAVPRCPIGFTGSTPGTPQARRTDSDMPLFVPVAPHRLPLAGSGASEAHSALSGLLMPVIPVGDGPHSVLPFQLGHGPQPLSSIGAVKPSDAKTARAACALRCKQKKSNNGGQACKIRYEMRKINAAQRPRFKGRFVKRDSNQTLDAMETDCLGSCASSDVSALSDASWLML